MYQTVYVTLLLMGGCLWVSVAGNDCPYQECYCIVDSIMCEDENLTFLPASFATNSSNLSSLFLDRNLITTIPAGSLPSNLTAISLNYNPIENIDDAAFDGSASTLNSLSFSNALFTRVPDAFLHLQALKWLSILESVIRDWNVDAMKHIGQTVESFDFIQYGLQTWPDWIQYLTHLTALSISSSSISTIPDDALDALANSLVTLTLINNSLTAVPKALSGLTVLETLHLSGNTIVDIGYLPQSNRLHTLSLDNNKISDAGQLSQVLRRYADTLTEIDIDHNHLTTVPDLSFLKQIASLDFAYNRISDPVSGSLPVGIIDVNFENNLLPYTPSCVSRLHLVFELTLTYNMVKVVRGTDIPQWIRTAQLDYNLITELTDSSFPQNSSIYVLNLNYNPLSQISISAFANLPLLTDVFLKGTKLTRVPLALISITYLNDLDISECPNLVCTCLEQSLVPLFKTMSEYDLWGNCGSISVYYFFVNLSKDCPT